MNQTADRLVPPPPKQRTALWITVLVLTSLAAVLLWRGYAYYRLDLVSRAEHPDYRLLNPAGFIGHGYGIVGTALIATNLLYLVRRRFAKVLPNWVGSMKA